MGATTLDGWSLPSPLGAEWRREIERATREGWVERLWRRDATLWTGGDEDRWLGWLDAPRQATAQAAALETFAAEMRDEGIDDVLLLGMGGSSLGPETLASVFERPRFSVLDSTVPAEVATAARRGDPERTLYVVASKSGSTLEPSVFFEYFWARETARRGTAAAARFVAITDPGSKLEALARERGLRAVFAGEPAIGGRYSVLSNFGLLPAALMGLDLRRLLARAETMAAECRREGADNPGLALGALLGVAARAGRDKLTLVVGPRFGAFGPWLEQLVAESTGKNGHAILPIEGEDLAAPDRYGEDRLFVAIAPAPDQERALALLAGGGQPVARIPLDDPSNLAAEFFRWEVATSFAGAVLGIHPFDQPDVEASKVETRKLTDAYERSGTLPDEGDTTAPDDVDTLRAHLARLGPGDYAAFLAYVERNATHRATLQRIRHRVRDARRVATCVGFGPRFLHSTGQAYKGGPITGVFVQITGDDAEDVAIPGRRATFGAVKAAQARGDLQVLLDRGRRALRVHLGADVGRDLRLLETAVTRALEPAR